MSGRGLKDNLLEGGDFSSISQEIQVNLQDIGYAKESIEQASDQIKNDAQVTDRILGIFRSSVQKMDKLLSQTEHLLSQLANVSSSSKEQGIFKKLEAAFSSEKKEHQERKDEFDNILKTKKLDKRIEKIPDRNYADSMMSSADSNDQMFANDLPVMQVYDQEKFVNQRHEKVKQIKRDAKDINDIAVVINQKVEDQGMMLDELDKNLENDKKVVIQANKELFEAAAITEKSKKSNKMCLLLLFVIIAGVVVFLLFELGVFGGKDNPNQ